MTIDPSTDAVVVGRPSNRELNEQLMGVVRPWGLVGIVGLLVAAAGTAVLGILVSYTIAEGIGVWGNNIPVAWAFAIINFVWWIGIGHAGTFISAIMLLLEQSWRTSINRIVEAMTLFAIVQAAMFPVLHLGRMWFAYWLIPYPATMGVWPNFKSALPWDAAAIFTYGTVSLLFWYLGLLPELAAMRDHLPGRWRPRIYGVFAMGWRGSAGDHRHYRLAYGLLAGLATPLVLSVHSVVSSDFAIAIVPGWHTTLLPPYFVAGAIYSGFAMVANLLIPIRRVFGLKNVITDRHLDLVGKMLLVNGWIVIYSYMVEWFFAWFSGEPYEFYQSFVARPTAPGAVVFWLSIFCNVIVVQVFWSARARRNPYILWFGALLIQVGMWSERFVIVVQSLERDFLPSAWRGYAPTWVDLGILGGTVCFFTLLFLIFLRLVPFVPIAELKELTRRLAKGERP
jgi:molybdopterin-containing oxidoreductase family membrane subunit